MRIRYGLGDAAQLPRQEISHRQTGELTVEKVSGELTEKVNTGGIRV